MRFAEITRNVLDTPDEYYIVHCISNDLAMGAGVAKQISNAFPDMKQEMEMNRQARPEIYEVGRVLRWNRVMNMITKEHYYDKPTYETMAQCLWNLRKHIEAFTLFEGLIEKIAMPRIGCGLDKLDWNKVKPLIHRILGETDVDIVVCNWPPKRGNE